MYTMSERKALIITVISRTEFSPLGVILNFDIYRFTRGWTITETYTVNGHQVTTEEKFTQMFCFYERALI